MHSHHRREDTRKGSAELYLSVESTGDEEERPIAHKIGTLEHQHRTLTNYYLNKIRDMEAVIQRQAQIKEDLTKQIHSLANEAKHQREHLATLTAEFTQNEKGRSQKHLDMVSSAYLIKQPLLQSQKNSRNGKAALFASEKLRSQRLKAHKSESSRDGDYFQHKSPENVKKRLQTGSRQIPRVEK